MSLGNVCEIHLVSNTVKECLVYSFCLAKMSGRFAVFFDTSGE